MPSLVSCLCCRSMSMRDQTSHMKEKYQARYQQQRRLSIRTPNNSKDNTPKVRQQHSS